MISREEVLQVANDLKVSPITEERIAYCMVEFDRMAFDDPTGYWEVWVEQLLDESEDADALVLIEDMIIDLVEHLKSNYLTSDVTSGEFILYEQIPTYNSTLQQHTLFIVQSAVNRFLKWDCDEDGFHNTVGAYLVGANCVTNHDGDYWAIEEFDSIDYNGVRYPVRTLTATIDTEADWTHSFLIAPESLLDALDDARENDDITAINVDNEIYHYVENAVFYESAENIAKNYLDTPMTIVKDED